MAETERRGPSPVGFVLCWIWTILAGLAGVIGLFYLGQLLAGITLILSALAACPLAASLLESQTGTKLGGGVRLALAVIFAGLAGLSIGQNPANWEKLLPAFSPAPIQAKTLVEHDGEFGNKTTAFFTPQGKDWDLEWSYDCSGLGDSGIFNAQVLRQGGGASGTIGVEKIGDRDSGTEHYHQSGTFYLQIVSECRWSVRVIG